MEETQKAKQERLGDKGETEGAMVGDERQPEGPQATGKQE